MSHWSNQYIGIPYAPLGRSREDGVDCWTLARLVYAEILQIELAELGAAYRDDADNALIADVIEEQKRVGEWTAIDPAQAAEFDLLVLRWKGLETHVGVVCGGGLFLHAMNGQESQKARIAEWRVRISGAYRHWSRA